MKDGSRLLQVAVVNGLAILRPSTVDLSIPLPAAEKIAVWMVGLGGFVLPELNGRPISGQAESLFRERLRIALPEQQPFWGYKTEMVQTTIRNYPVACITKKRPWVVTDFLNGTLEREFIAARRKPDRFEMKRREGQMIMAQAHLRDCHSCRWEKLSAGIPERQCPWTMRFLLGEDIIERVTYLH